MQGMPYIYRMEKPLHRIICGFIALVFAAFAALQFNDPDPLVWVLCYGTVTLMAGMQFMGRLPGTFPVLTGIGFLAWSLAIFPWGNFNGFSGKMEGNPGVEEARESVGLMIAVVALAYLAWRARRISSAS